MARKKAPVETKVESIRHKDKRTNIPTEDLCEFSHAQRRSNRRREFSTETNVSGSLRKDNSASIKVPVKLSRQRRLRRLTGNLSTEGTERHGKRERSMQGRGPVGTSSPESEGATGTTQTRNANALESRRSMTRIASTDRTFVSTTPPSVSVRHNCLTP